VSAYGVATHEGEDTSSVGDNKASHSNQVEYSKENQEESLEELVRRITKDSIERDLQTLERSENFQGQQEHFENEIAGYTAFIKLKKDEIRFLDSEGVPVGEPQKFQEYVDIKEGFAGKYLYTPGNTDENGILSDVPAKEWRQYVEQKVQNDFPEAEIADDMNVIRLFQAAYKSGDEELKKKITTGEITTQEQILEHRVEKSFAGSDGLNRVEYLQKNVTFRSQLEEVAGVPGAEKRAVPPSVQKELRTLLPGLLAQESGFQEDIVNERTQAKGSGQFMPETWKRYTGEEEVSTDFTDQIEVLGPAISDMYDRVLDIMGDEAVENFRSLFPNEETFLIDLVTPMAIGGYNTGPDRIAYAAKKYNESIQLNDMPAGKDLFIAIANYAELSDEGLLSGYKHESREYVTRVYAAAQVLAEKYPLKELTEDRRIAQH